MNTINTLPPVTDAHRLAAFAAMRWASCTYAQAMACTVKSRVIECRAAQLRTQEWERTTKRTVVPVRRLRLGADGHPMGWCTQMAQGNYQPITEPDFFKPHH